MARLQVERKPEIVNDLSKLPLVMVVWEDAMRDWEHDGLPEEVDDDLPILQEYGLLIKENRRLVKVASSSCYDDDTVRNVVKIPRKMVRAIIRVLEPADIQARIKPPKGG